MEKAAAAVPLPASLAVSLQGRVTQTTHCYSWQCHWTKKEAAPLTEIRISAQEEFGT